MLTQALQALQDADIALVDVGLRRSTLDDVFLTLTGHRTDGDQDDSSDAPGASAEVGAP